MSHRLAEAEQGQVKVVQKGQDRVTVNSIIRSIIAGRDDNVN